MMDRYFEDLDKKMDSIFDNLKKKDSVDLDDLRECVVCGDQFLDVNFSRINSASNTGECTGCSNIRSAATYHRHSDKIKIKQAAYREEMRNRKDGVVKNCYNCVEIKLCDDGIYKCISNTKSWPSRIRLKNIRLQEEEYRNRAKLCCILKEGSHAKN